MSEQIHINFSNELQEKILGKETTNTTEKYILCMNDLLQAKEKDNLLKIQKLELDLEENENNLESLEQKHNYNKNLLKNFHEMNKMHVKLTDYYCNMLNTTQNNVSTFKYKATKHLTYLQMCIIGVVGLFLEFYPFAFVFNVILILLTITAFQKSTLMNLNLPLFEKEKLEIDKIKKEITTTEASQDYIYEFIDNL